MVSFYRGIAHQTLKNQPIGNVKIRCRLEKIDKNGKPQQAGDHRALYSFASEKRKSPKPYQKMIIY
jgi:hypothetical protein